MLILLKRSDADFAFVDDYEVSLQGRPYFVPVRFQAPDFFKDIFGWETQKHDSAGEPLVQENQLFEILVGSDENPVFYPRFRQEDFIVFPGWIGRRKPGRLGYLQV